MYDLLSGLRVVEGSSFVAAPFCGLHLLQLGAEVIRFDNIGGGPDFRRWPKTPEGNSLYWEGLNKGKKSIAIDLQSPEGRELAVSLITAPGHGTGIFLTNYPVSGFLAHERLSKHRADLITIRVMGWADGTSAVDYTINCAVGVPDMTGPAESDAPVNHVLPAWDLLAGTYAAYGLLALERRRSRSGVGGELRVPLSDLAMATLGHLGQIGEVTVAAADRAKSGNNLFGAFGRDFLTADGKRLMIVALTPRQWSGLLTSLGLEQAVAALEQSLGISFALDEGNRWIHRERLNPLVESAVASRRLDEIAPVFDQAGVCYGEYQTLKTALESNKRFSENPVFQEIEHGSGYRYRTPGFAGTLMDSERRAPTRAPRLGEHTTEILMGVLGLPDHEIARLHDRKVVASA